MDTVPAATPVTMPVPGPIVAIDVFPLLQLPPGVASLIVMLPPAQTIVDPVIGETGSTVNEDIAIHPPAVA